MNKSIYLNKFIKYIKKIDRQMIQTIQSGGSRIFYVFTTGLVSFGGFGPFEHFLNFLLERIVQIIPPRYTEIKVISYDSSYLDTDDRFMDQLTDFISVKIPEKTTELTDRYRRIITMTHIVENFMGSVTMQRIFESDGLVYDAVAGAGGYVQQKHYILIDAAHIYKYTNIINTVRYSGYYGNEDIGIIPMNSIYLNYFITKDAVEGKNDDDSEFTNVWINHANFFKVLDDGQVRTYYDMMIEFHYSKIDTEELCDPQYLQIEELYNSIIKYVNSKYNKKHPTKLTGRNLIELYNIINSEIFKKNITVELINYIIEGVSEHDVMQIMTDYANSFIAHL